MSSKIKLMDRLKESPVTISLSKFTSLAVDRLAPDWAYRHLDNLLLKPKSRKVDLTRLPQGIGRLKIDTKEGNLQAYVTGQGPAVVLVHGWSGGAHQFFLLMRGLAHCGFKAIAFDHFAHGHSDGEKTSLERFITGTNYILKYVSDNVVDGTAGIVAHDLGCIAVANAQPRLLGDTPLMMIAPIFNYREFFARLLQRPGLHPQLANKYLARLEQANRLDNERTDLASRLKAYADRTVIVHDKNDDVSNFVQSVKFCAANPLTQINITQGLGHDHIVQSESVWQQLKSQLNYEDITANLFR